MRPFLPVVFLVLAVGCATLPKPVESLFTTLKSDSSLVSEPALRLHAGTATMADERAFVRGCLQASA